MKVNSKRTILMGFAFLSICTFWQMYDNIIPLILKNTFQLNEVATGFVMSVDNILAVFLLPLMGAFSDKVDTRWGKRTPFIVIGTIFAIIAMMFLPYASNINNLYLFVGALAITLIAMATYRSPAVALMPDLTPKPLRSKANAIINLMGTVGGIIALVLIRMLLKDGDKVNYTPIFIGVAIVMVVSVIILLLTIKEKKLADEVKIKYPETEENEHLDADGKLDPDVVRSLKYLLASIFFWFVAYNAVTTAFSRYAKYTWKMQGGSFTNCLMVATIAAVLSYIPVGVIAGKLGRKKTILAGVLMMFISYVAAIFYANYHPSINVFFALIGIGWAFINVNSFPMVVEMCKGADVGRYTGFYYTASMSAQILTPILSGIFLQYISYRTLFPYAAVFAAIAFFTMTKVKHGDVKPIEKKSALEHFDIDD